MLRNVKHLPEKGVLLYFHEIHQFCRFIFDGKRNDIMIAKKFDLLLIELAGNQLVNTFNSFCH
jgi:hypothetical protein